MKSGFCKIICSYLYFSFLGVQYLNHLIALITTQVPWANDGVKDVCLRDAGLARIGNT